MHHHAAARQPPPVCCAEAAPRLQNVAFHHLYLHVRTAFSLHMTGNTVASADAKDLRSFCQEGAPTGSNIKVMTPPSSFDK